MCVHVWGELGLVSQGQCRGRHRISQLGSYGPQVHVCGRHVQVCAGVCGRVKACEGGGSAREPAPNDSSLQRLRDPEDDTQAQVP